METLFRAMIQEIPGAPPVEWGVRPQGQPYPGIVLNLVSDVSGHTQQGSDGLSASRIQVDAYAETFREAKAISRAIRARLDGASQGVIQGIFRVGGRDSTHDVDGKSVIYRSSQDFRVAWTV